MNAAAGYTPRCDAEWSSVCVSALDANAQAILRDAHSKHGGRRYKFDAADAWLAQATQTRVSTACARARRERSGSVVTAKNGADASWLTTPDLVYFDDEGQATGATLADPSALLEAAQAVDDLNAQDVVDANAQADLDACDTKQAAQALGITQRRVQQILRERRAAAAQMSFDFEDEDETEKEGV